MGIRRGGLEDITSGSHSSPIVMMEALEEQRPLAVMWKI